MAKVAIFSGHIESRARRASPAIYWLSTREFGDIRDWNCEKLVSFLVLVTGSILVISSVAPMLDHGDIAFFTSVPVKSISIAWSNASIPVRSPPTVGSFVSTSSCISFIVSAVTVRVTVSPVENEKAVVPGVLLASFGRQVPADRVIVSVSPVRPVTFTISRLSTAYGATASFCFTSHKKGKVEGNLSPCPDPRIIVPAPADIPARRVPCALFHGTYFWKDISKKVKF